jgi:hypothetical protein
MKMLILLIWFDKLINLEKKFTGHIVLLSVQHIGSKYTKHRWRKFVALIIYFQLDTTNTW